MSDASTPDASTPDVSDASSGEEGRRDRRSAAQGRFYIVQSRPTPQEGLCLLDDGRAVLCAIDDRADARIAASGYEDLEVVRHSDLDVRERERVREALQ
jgi:hypothetical protein